MTLDQLRIFVAVAEQQHVTRAANVLALSQSAVSSSIAALEAQYDVKLFHRIRRNIVLTDAGQQFLNEARAVLARASSAGNMLADLAGLRRGALSLAASQTVANYWIPKVMQRFHAAYPGVSLKLSITNTGQVVRQVAEGAVDLGFVEDQVDTDGLDVRAVAQRRTGVWWSPPATPGPVTIRRLPMLLTCAIAPGCCVNRNRVRAGSSKRWCAAWVAIPPGSRSRWSFRRTKRCAPRSRLALARP